MPKPQLDAPFAQLEADIIETLIAGLHEWRSDLSYPESHSDMQGAVRALLRMFEVRRLPVARVLPIFCERCRGKGRVEMLQDEARPDIIKAIPCPQCRRGTE